MAKPLRLWRWGIEIFRSKFIKVLKYIKSLCIIIWLIDLNIFTKKSDNFLSKSVSNPQMKIWPSGQIISIPLKWILLVSYVLILQAREKR